MSTPDWRTAGVRVIPADALDTNTPQTPGMHRAAAVTGARTGAQGLWAGTVTILPGARTGAHHHGALESVICVVRQGDETETSLMSGRASPGDEVSSPW